MVTTFVPVADVEASCQLLDNDRLGKQRSEIKIMLAAITGVRFKCAQGENGIILGEKRGYQNHSATRMWQHNPLALAHFGVTNCTVWADRFGHSVRDGKGSDTLKDMLSWVNWLTDNGSDDDMPEWWGREDVHSSHRAVLLSKDLAYYSRHGWSEEPKYEYVWPA